jgi:predicted amidohydrolase
MSLKVAVLQGLPLTDDCNSSNAARIATVLSLAEKAVAAGCGLLVLPELFLAHGKSKAAQPADGPLMEGMAALSSTVGLALCVTYCEVDDDGRRYSSAALFDATGKSVLHRRKVRLGGGVEGRMYSPGSIDSSIHPVELRGALVDEPHSAVRIGVAIGTELEHPASSQLLAVRGAQLLLVPSSGGMPTHIPPTRARDNCLGVVLASPTFGGLYDPNGDAVAAEAMPLEGGGKLVIGVIDGLGDHTRQRLPCELELDRALGSELLGIADETAFDEVRAVASKEADEMSMSLRRTLQALQAEDDEDEQTWSSSDVLAAFGCVMCNLFVGVALAAVASILLMAEPPESPCRGSEHAGVAGMTACAGNLALAAVATGRGEPLPEHVCSTSPLWTQNLLRVTGLCPAAAAAPDEGLEHSTPALLSMDVQHGGIVLAGRRLFGSSSTLSIWEGEDPSEVAERWLLRNGGGIDTADARRAVVKLLVDAARQTSVDHRIAPWAEIPIELGGVDAPLPVFEGDVPLEVAQWYVEKQTKVPREGNLKTPLGPTEVQVVARAVRHALAAPRSAVTLVPPPPLPPPPLPPPVPPGPELLFVLPVSDGKSEHELEVFAGDVPQDIAQNFVEQHDLLGTADDAVAQIEAAILAEHRRLAEEAGAPATAI